MIEYFEMSPYQQNIFNLAKAYPNLGIANIGGMVQFSIDKDIEILKKVCQLLVEYQSAFRIRVSKENQLYKTEYSPFPIQEYYFHDKTQEEIEDIISFWMKQAFEIYDSDLFEFKIIHTKDKRILFEKYHHMILDGSAVIMAIAFREQLYKKVFAEEKIELYEDNRFVEKLQRQHWWLSNETYDEAKEWFRSELKDLEINWKLKDNIARLQSKKKIYTIRKELNQEIEKFCYKNNISKEAFFYASLYCYISKVKGVNDIAIGRIMANRRREEKKIIGMMVNTLPLRIEAQNNQNFIQLCNDIDEKLMKILRFSRYSLSELNKECNIKNSLFDISVSYRTKQFAIALKDGKLTELFNGYCENPLRIFCNELSDGWEFEFYYNIDLYTEIEIDNMVDRLFHIMEYGSKDIPLKDISILNQQDIKSIQAFNDTKYMIQNEWIHQRFERQAKNFPNHIALVFQNQHMNYSEVSILSDTVANRLLEHDIVIGDIVGICMERGLLLPIVMLGILKIGASFLPISILDSDERKIKLSQICRIVLTDKESEHDKFINISSMLKNREKLKNKVNINGKDIAYLMYTSGSTDLPKCVKICHESLLYRFLWAYDVIGCDGVTLQKTRNSFDVSVWELLLPLTFGNTLCLLEEGAEKFPDIIAKTIVDNNVNMLHFVPSMLKAFLNYCEVNKVDLPMLKKIISSGESLNASYVEQFYRLFPHAKIYNLYGPTECTIDVSYYECKKGDKKIPIGVPIYNTRLFVVNAQREILPRGIEGELCIVGDLVGQGYYGIEKSKQYIEFQDERAFLTGDIVTLDFDNMLYYIGRKDNQKKFRGMRIDLGAIENILLQYDGISQAVVVIKDNRLVAYYSSEHDIMDLDSYLGRTFPYYSIPNLFIKVKDMPINKNGKIDRKALENLSLAKKTINLPRTDIEKIICKEVGKYIGLEMISIDENLLDLGLDSISILNVVNDLERLEVKLKYIDFYTKPTIRELGKLQLEKKENKLLYLSKKNSNKLLVAIPYAGAEAESFMCLSEKLFNYNIDIASVLISDFKNKSAEGIAQELVDKIPAYEEIYVLGYCVGSVVAIEIAHILNKNNKNIKGLMICASLPTKQFSLTINPWSIINDKLLGKTLEYLHGEKINFSDENIRQFRIDTNRYFEYMKKSNQYEFDFKVSLIFGEKDEITLGYKKKYKIWHRYMQAKFTVYQVKNARHFFLKTHTEKLSKIIIREVERK